MQNTRSSLRGSFPTERERERTEIEARQCEKESSIGICSFSVPFLEDTKKWRSLRWVGRSPNNCAIIEVGTWLSPGASTFVSHAKLCSYPFGRVCLSFINLTCKVQPRWPVTQPVCIWPSLSSTGPQHPWAILGRCSIKAKLISWVWTFISVASRSQLLLFQALSVVLKFTHLFFVNVGISLWFLKLLKKLWHLFLLHICFVELFLLCSFVIWAVKSLYNKYGDIECRWNVLSEKLFE